MSKDELLEYTCVALDLIRGVTDKLNVGGDAHHAYLQAGTNKQDVYTAIVKIKHIVSKIDELDEEKDND